MTILGTGLSGLVGTRIIDLYPQFNFENLSQETGVDITNKDFISDRIKNSKAEVVVHMAAKTNVDGCELDKERDLENLKKGKDEQEIFWKTEKTAWSVNVFGTENIAKACKEANKKLIYISTDFVFDGVKDFYEEKDKPNPISWYGTTKYEGEKTTAENCQDYLILRLAYPYRSNFQKTDFVRTVIALLKEGKELKMVTDHVMAPTFIDDFANALIFAVQEKLSGIYHVVGSEFITPYDAAFLISQTFNLDANTISKTTREEYFKNRAARPFRLALKNDKISKLGIKMRRFSEGLNEVKKQLEI